ncbi:hypothetical protein Q3G72_024017 [Acer saccharum]|nr:hypothetical protein Q3G72_024017 [Acer saccharum]
MSYGEGTNIQKGFGSLIDLRKLDGVRLDSKMLEELKKLRQLRVLGIQHVNGNGKDLFSSIANMNHLKNLCIELTNRDETFDIESVASPPKYLERLYLLGNLKKLPDWIFNLQNLAKVYLTRSDFTDDPMRVLHSLPNLLILYLLDVYNDEQLHIKQGWFPKLRKLFLGEFKGLKFIMIEDGAMSLLETLTISACPLLKVIPSGVENLRNLSFLHFHNMLMEIESNSTFVTYETLEKLKHIPKVLVSFYDKEKKMIVMHLKDIWHLQCKDTNQITGGAKTDKQPRDSSKCRQVWEAPLGSFKLNVDADIGNLAKNGLGLVNQEKVFSFYNELHLYLASAGIDGVKVDVQNILETLGAGHGGRVKLARKYHQALEASIARNFHNNDIISCMSHNTDDLYSAKRTAVIRASDDCWPRDAASHTIHIASVAYNTVFLGEFMQPDWDMFHSLHPMAEYHGAARAVGGCAIYVSLLKIWNLNDFTGVMGVFNCQGAGWCKIGKTNLIHDEQPGTISGYVRTKDVDYLPRLATDQWTGDTIVYSHLGGEVVYLPKNATIPITLKSREYEVFTVVPVKEFSNNEAKLAPIGLIKMFNSGGANKELRYDEAEGTATADMKVRGCGLFGAYSSACPKRIQVDSEEVQFGYNEESGLVTLDLIVLEAELYLWNVTIEL